ncbi:MAG: lysylphosphatidylglycerol synthase transmembrane domain-containing protein [Geminicoccaceae bacterium]
MRGWLRFALGLATLGVLVVLVDWQLALSRIAAAEHSYTIAAIVVGMTGLLFAALRWWQVVLGSRAWMPLSAAIRVHWAGVFWNQFLPTGFGGDIVRFTLGRHYVRASTVAASIMVERLTGLIVVLMLAWIAATGWAAHLGATTAELSYAGVAMASAAVALVVFGTVAVTMWLGVGHRYVVFVLRFLPAPIRIRLTALGEALAVYIDRPSVLVRAGLMSLPCHFATFLVQFLVLRAVGAPIGLGEVLLVAPLMPLVGLVALTPNGIGITEAVFVALYLPLGVPPDMALAAAALRRLTDLAAASGGGITWLTVGSRERAAARQEQRRFARTS